ncbi:conserved hypothetical protein [Gammaproteobacteria bacterium]
MQAIEFEATPMHHNIRLPADVPDGIPMRVVLLWEQPTIPVTSEVDLKQLFVSVVDGLTEDDLNRQKDMGREMSWDI